MTGHDRLRELVSLDALDALGGGERDEVETHLRTCSECAAELDAHRAVAASLVADRPASPEGWERISSALDLLERQSAPAEEVGVTDLARQRGIRRGRAGWGAVAAAAVVVIVALAGVGTVLRQGGPDDVVAAAEEAAELPGSVVAELETDSGAVARVVLTAEGEGFLVPTGFDALGADRTYQLWVVTGDALVISAGVLGNEPGPSRFTWAGEVSGFALTREVAGGVVSSAGDVVASVET